MTSVLASLLLVTSAACNLYDFPGPVLRFSCRPTAQTSTFFETQFAGGINFSNTRLRTVQLGLLPPGRYTATWSQQFPSLVPDQILRQRIEFTVDPAPRRRSYAHATSLGVDARSATLELTPLRANTPMAALITISGDGEATNSVTQPWVRVEGSNVFIDVEFSDARKVLLLAAIPPLEAGPYDAFITGHQAGVTAFRTHQTLVIPQ